jgi:hypothetical protein
MDFLKGLNEAQKAAITAEPGPVLVLAGPGSGKTRVLTHRIVYLIQELGVSPWHIMAVTFTNKAAREMGHRIENLLGGSPQGLMMGTFHSTCVRILRREWESLPGYGRDFVIFDTDDQRQVVKQALKDLNLDDKKFTPNRMLAGISNAKNELVTAEAYAATNYISEITRRVYQRYQDILVTNNAMDFDDLLMNVVLLFDDRSEVLQKYQQRYEHILVDEFQDTNTAQYGLLNRLAAGHGNIFVVGDSDQSIYKWRGADFRNINRFRQQYPEAQMILLEQNYRSTQIILDAAKAVMNSARIGVGMNAVALGYVAYQDALAYARERPQGRPLSAKDPSSPPVPILRHGDVRRMLLAQKACVEGGLALVLYCSKLTDLERCAADDSERARINELLELLTPIAKSWPSEYCLEANKLAIQVHGGYGYTRDYPVERLYRDNRLNHIHEGTHGIHGLDLLGRKVPMHGGAALKELFGRMQSSIAAAQEQPELAVEASSLAAAIDDIAATTRVLVAAMAGDPERALANATLYLDSLGHAVVAWRWLDQAIAALAASGAAGTAESDFYAGKLVACRYFYRYELPRIAPALALLRALDDTALTFPDGRF